MNTRQFGQRWDELARTDAMWAVLTDDAKRGGQWDSHEFLASGTSDVNRVLDRLNTIGISPARGRALDFGCGLGRLTRALATHFREVDGIDISAEMIARAPGLHPLPANVRLLHNPHPHLRLLKSGDYDFILSLISLQHIPESGTLRYVADLSRVLKPGGSACLQVGTFLNPDLPEGRAKLRRDRSALNQVYRRLREMLRPKADPMNTYYSRLSRLTSVLEDAHMRIIAVLPDNSMGSPFVSHVLVFERPASG